MLTCPNDIIGGLEKVTDSSEESNKTNNVKFKEVPVLLRDAVASLILILVNLPIDIQKSNLEIISFFNFKVLKNVRCKQCKTIDIITIR